MKRTSLSILSLLLLIFPNVLALPLSTSSRWIVDENGRRVKLACVNWVSHLEVMVAEGLSKKPVDEISKDIVSMGFNCVRLTWPLYLVTDDSLANLTVRQSFQNLGLVESISGLQSNNPSIVDLSLINAYKAVVSSLGDNDVMVILDNHITKPGWCCSNSDGNGFFGDKLFNPDLWINGLTKMATIFNGVSNVIGMSLRNELRGPRQNTKDWYRYMQKGAEAVHSANPDVLVIVSGLSFDTDLSFLHTQPLSLSFQGKLVYELHWYAFSDGSAWVNGNPNQVCGSVTSNVIRRAGFLLDQGHPLFVSEFGFDQRGTNVNDNRYLSCFLGLAAELDFDWALWTLVGSYALREGVVGLEEMYGLLNWDWSEIRNATLLQRISSIQAPRQGPGSSSRHQHKLIYHPSTGLCVLRKSTLAPLELGPCAESEGWIYSPQKIFTVAGTYFCIQAEGLNQPVDLGIICGDSNSRWEAISDSKMHLSAKLSNGTVVCMDVDATNTIIASSCKCLSSDKTCDPGNQWFKIVNISSFSASLNSPALIKAEAALISSHEDLSGTTVN